MKWLRNFVTVVSFIFVAFMLLSIGAGLSSFKGGVSIHSEDSVLEVLIEGVIVDGKEVLRQLKFAEKDYVKAVVLRINSPGGVVGASQEIYSEVLRIRDKLQKPIVVSCNSVAASGAYYVAVAANKILVNPGTVMGSIGVIMQFANLQKLYKWAKIDVYTVKSGSFKDAGGTHRPLNVEERKYFQLVIKNIEAQFKKAVKKNRKLADHIINKYSDGRIFSGATAVNLGFADQTGTLRDARNLAGKLSGLGENPKVFQPPKIRKNFLEEIFRLKSQTQGWSSLPLSSVHLKLIGQPLYLMPGWVE